MSITFWSNKTCFLQCFFYICFSRKWQCLCLIRRWLTSTRGLRRNKSLIHWKEGCSSWPDCVIRVYWPCNIPWRSRGAVHIKNVTIFICLIYIISNILSFLLVCFLQRLSGLLYRASVCKSVQCSWSVGQLAQSCTQWHQGLQTVWCWDQVWSVTGKSLIFCFKVTAIEMFVCLVLRVFFVCFLFLIPAELNGT